jgi:hypothetical protein
VRSGSGTAAVDGDGDAVDEAGVVAGEVGDRGGDLFWIGDAAGRYQGCELADVSPKPSFAGVRVGPGATALTWTPRGRIRRSRP